MTTATVQGALLAAVVLVVAAVALFPAAAYGTTYTVGEPGGGWDTRTNLTAWASSVAFHPGDRLLFKYDASAHDVVEVTAAGYRACSAAGAAVSAGPLRTGSDAVQLGAVGRRYFVCGVPGHCQAGMKLAVTVVPGDAAVNVGCNSTTPAAASPAAGNGAVGAQGGITICDGDSPTVVMTPGVVSYSSAPGSSATLVSSVLVTMVSLLPILVYR